MSILFSHFLSKYNEITPQESDFTEVLSTIALVPKMLYFYGKIPKNRVKSVAIVGSRKPTAYGCKIARDLAFAVASRGGIVISGLAYGIDSEAHRGALEANGVTLAILGTPIDKIYPRSHQGLAEEIIEKGGAIISEMPPGAEYYPKTSFLERNRLISGLADVIVVVEAAERSGSLNTAAHALEQGREIFAVPGNIDRPMSVGCNKLIARGGANIYTGVEDVVDLLFPRSKPKIHQNSQKITGDTPVETTILQCLARGVTEGEEILQESGLQAHEFNCNITLLEVKGLVKSLGMNCWTLA